MSVTNRSSMSASIQIKSDIISSTMTYTFAIYFPRYQAMSQDANVPHRRYTVVLKDEGKLHAPQLRDVNGNILRDTDGRVLSIFDQELSDLIKDGAVRFIHKVNPGYVYIVTNTTDELVFQHERDNGSEHPYTQYTVYFDDDFVAPNRSPWAHYHCAD